MTTRSSAPKEHTVWTMKNTEESDPILRSSDVAFFFGAGASIEAGVPDTAGLLKEFELIPSENAEAIKNLLSRLKTWAGMQSPARLIDLELVLETLQHAENWKSNPLVEFVTGKLKMDDIEPEQLLRSLRDFVKDRVMVQAENIKYLAPLRGFVDQHKPLNIFSANYDTAVEVFCAEHKLKYRDGFDEVWNPRVFDEPDIHIKLFKIHGSVTWYRTDRGRFVKIPTMVKGSSVELFTKERADLVMLYPAQKFEYVEPLFELTLQMKRELAQCETLFVVGYSFRDEHLRRLFWDIARQYSDFYVVLVDPNAQRIYCDRLQRYDVSDTPSSLAGRVLRLPYRFGKAFPWLQSVTYRAFRKMRTAVDTANAAERQGQVTHWQNCILPAAECGDYETLRMVLEKVADQKHSNYLDLMKSISLALFHAVANSDQEFVKYYWSQLQSEALAPMEGLILAVVHHSEGNFLQPTMLGGTQSPTSLISVWDHAHKSVESRLEWIGSDTQYQCRALIDLLRGLSECMSVWKNGNARFDDYLNKRGAFAQGNLATLLQALSKSPNMMWEGQDRHEHVQIDVRKTETHVLACIFNKYHKKVLTPPRDKNGRDNSD